MTVTTFDLGPTETYRERVAVWVGGGDTAADRFLTITTRAGNRTTTVTYAVNTDRSRGRPLVHLRPLRDTTDGGPYWVERRDNRWTCSCRGFRPDTSCKHCDAVAAVQKEGVSLDAK